MEKKFVANKALITNPQGKILLLRDSSQGDHANSKGKLDVPGGRMDKGETPSEALAREIKEETGLVINPKKTRPVHVDIWGVMGDVENQPVIGTFYIVQIKEEQVSLSDEHTEVVWYDPRQPIPQNMKGAVKAAIESFRKQEGIVTEVSDEIKGKEGFGLIQVITGNGKGKTTSALGQGLRAASIGKKVGIVFFDKGGDSHYSERSMIEKIENMNFIATGCDRIDSNTGKFDFSINQIDKDEAKRGLKEVKQMFDDKYDLVVMDEINSSTDLGLIEREDVLRLIEHKPEKTELILTGRNAPDEFIQKAHLVSEVRLKKHYFYSGVPAREGLDF